MKITAAIMLVEFGHQKAERVIFQSSAGILGTQNPQKIGRIVLTHSCKRWLGPQKNGIRQVTEEWVLTPFLDNGTQLVEYPAVSCKETQNIIAESTQGKSAVGGWKASC